MDKKQKIKFKLNLIKKITKIFQKYIINQEELTLEKYYNYLKEIYFFDISEQNKIKEIYNVKIENNNNIFEEFFLKKIKNEYFSSENNIKFKDIPIVYNKFNLALKIFNFIKINLVNNNIIPIIEITYQMENKSNNIDNSKFFNNDVYYYQYLTKENNIDQIKFDLDKTIDNNYSFSFLVKKMDNKENSYSIIELSIDFLFKENFHEEQMCIIDIMEDYIPIEYSSLYSFEFETILRIYYKFFNTFKDELKDLIYTILYIEVLRKKNLELHLIFKNIDFSKDIIVKKIYNHIIKNYEFYDDVDYENISYFLKKIN